MTLDVTLRLMCSVHHVKTQTVLRSKVRVGIDRRRNSAGSFSDQVHISLVTQINWSGNWRVHWNEDYSEGLFVIRDFRRVKFILIHSLCYVK